MRMTKCYSDLIQLDSFIDRYHYLKLHGAVGESTFGYDRWINQELYKSGRWRRTRSRIIVRDEACDLGVDGYDLPDHIVIHHINPITLEDIEEERDVIFDPENLISC